jgi:hypothetical protein
MAGQRIEQPPRGGGERDERVRVRHWRRDRFMELGFSLSDASALAKSSADLSETRKLITEGCELATVFRIVR